MYVLNTLEDHIATVVCEIGGSICGNYDSAIFWDVTPARLS